jgi:hypothetical protein
LQTRDRTEIEGMVKNCCPPSIRDGWRHKAQFEGTDGTLYLSGAGDTGAIFCLAARDVAERVAWKMLVELEQNIQLSGVDLTSSTPDSLTAPLKKILRSCLQKDGEGGDKLAEVQGKVDAVTGIMQTNVKTMMDNRIVLDGLDEKTDALAEQGSSFLKQSQSLRHQMRMRALKMKCCAILAILSIIGYFVVGFLPDDFGSNMNALGSSDGQEADDANPPANLLI